MEEEADGLLKNSGGWIKAGRPEADFVLFLEYV